VLRALVTVLKVPEKQRVSEQILYICAYIIIVSKIFVSERPTVAKLKKLLKTGISYLVDQSDSVYNPTKIIYRQYIL